MRKKWKKPEKAIDSIDHKAFGKEVRCPTCGDPVDSIFDHIDVECGYHEEDEDE